MEALIEVGLILGLMLWALQPVRRPFGCDETADANSEDERRN
jgi:hypothetical protein